MYFEIYTVDNCCDCLILGSLNILDRQPRLPPTVIDVAAGSIGTFPLGLGHASHYVKPRMALIG
jgi:hypothetical protein